MGRFFCGAFFGGAFFVYILGFTVLAVGGVDAGSSGGVVIKGKLVIGAAGGWLGPLGSTIQDGGRLRKGGKSERVGSLSLITLCLVGCLPMMVGRQLVFLDVSKLCWLLMDLVRGLIDRIDENKLKTEVGGEDDEIEKLQF